MSYRKNEQRRCIAQQKWKTYSDQKAEGTVLSGAKATVKNVVKVLAAHQTQKT